MTHTADIHTTARARFFARRELRRIIVEPAGSVLVWDRIAGHYTTCHMLSARTQRRIARRYADRFQRSAEGKRIEDPSSAWSVYRRGRRWYVEARDARRSIDARLMAQINDAAGGFATRGRALAALREWEQ